MRLLAALALAALLAPGVLAQDAAPVDVGMCPLMPWEPAKASIYLEHEGARVYFCCKRCRHKWIAGQAEAHAAAAAATAEAERRDAAGSAGSHTTQGGGLNFELLPLPGGDGSPPPPEAAPVLAEGPIEGEEEVFQDHRASQTAMVEGAAGVTGATQGGWITELGRWHPVAVHFPIALLILAAIAELLFLVSRSPLYEDAARFNVLAGTAAAPVAALLGLASASAGADPVAMADTFSTHRALGIATALAAPLLAYLSETCRGPGRGHLRKLYVALLLITAVLVGAAGHFGGKLVYG